MWGSGEVSVGTATYISLDEYLHTSYEHDPEWVNGQLKERGVPDGYHSYFQGWFLAYFDRRKMELALRALAEVRIRVSPRTFRLPDVLVIPMTSKFLPLPVEAPILCIEILSPDDRLGDLEEKLKDYVAMGVKTTWVLDPRRRVMSVANASGLREVEAFTLTDASVSITKGELFTELDALENSLTLG